MDQNLPLKTDGLSYAGDEGTMSIYAIRAAGKTAALVLVDNENPLTEEEATAMGLAAPEGTTLHRIYLATPDRKVTIKTTGVGAKAPHVDENGVHPGHIDGITVAQYIGPRIVRLLGELIEARSQV